MGSFTNHSSFTKPIKWLLLTLGVKLTLYFLFILPDNNPGREFAGCFIKSADHTEYIRPIDNFIEKGTYSLDGSIEPYAGRLPGLVFPYILFRAVFSEGTSNLMLGVFILGLSVFASYLFSLLLFNLTQKRWAFVTGFILINFIPFYWYYDWALHANSIAASCLIFFTFFLYKYTISSTLKNLLFTGFFLAWLVLLRGFTLVFIPITILFLIYILVQNKKSFKQILIAGFIFLLPITIFETAWVTRNYISLHKFIPLQTSFVPGSDSKNPEYTHGTITKYSMMKVRQLIFAWGGDNTWYFKNADMAWFSKRNSPLVKDFKFDDAIFFAGFTIDSLILLQSSILHSYENTLNSKARDSIEILITETSQRYYRNFCEKKKIYFYIYAPFKRLKNYLFRNVTQDWPGFTFENSGAIQKSIKLISLAEYFILLCCVLIFPLFYYKSRNSNSKIYLFFYFLILSNIIPFTTLIHMSHFTYFIFGYIFLIPLFIFIINSLKLFNNIGKNG